MVSLMIDRNLGSLERAVDVGIIVDDNSEVQIHYVPPECKDCEDLYSDDKGCPLYTLMQQNNPNPVTKAIVEDDSDDVMVSCMAYLSSLSDEQFSDSFSRFEETLKPYEETPTVPE